MSETEMKEILEKQILLLSEHSEFDGTHARCEAAEEIMKIILFLRAN